MDNTMQETTDKGKKVSDDAELTRLMRQLENLGHSDLIEYVTKEYEYANRLHR